MNPHRSLRTLCLSRRPWARRLLDRAATSDSGMTTAEYAVGTLAACGFAGVLLKVVTSTSVHNALAGLLARALASAG